MLSRTSDRAIAFALCAATLLAVGAGGTVSAAADPGAFEGSGGQEVTIQEPGGGAVIYRDEDMVDGRRVTIERDGNRVIIHREGAPDIVCYHNSAEVPGPRPGGVYFNSPTC
ncbi:hypothetical protein AB0C65_26090 [Nocardia sp. NPDC048505]